MAARVFLLSVVCTVGLIAGRTIGLELGWGLGVGGEPGDVVVGRGKSLLLPCTPTHPANVTWTLNGQPLRLDQRHSLFPNGTLYIKKVIHKKKGHGSSDAGVYRCTVRNKQGAIVSRPANVQIAGMSHEFSTDPDNTTALEGDLVRLTCSIESIPPATISWQRDYQLLPHNKRYVTTDSGVLYIVNVKKEDSGNYRCQATNKLLNKSRESREGALSVSHGSNYPTAAQFLPNSPPSLLILHEGKNASLVCAVKGVPRPTLTWIHNRNDTNITLQTTTNGLNVWKVPEVTRAHVGTYTCTAAQSIREKVTSAQKVLKVEVYSPPVSIRNFKSQFFKPAKTVRIGCEILGFPEPTITWLKDAQKLHINGRIKQSGKDLVLGGLVTQDTGIYQCIAGNAWDATRLVVNTSSSPPPAPEQLSCVAISPTTVNLTWVPPRQKNLVAYSVHYFPTGGGIEDRQVTKNITFTVTKLAPYTNYTFYVRAYHIESASEQSQRVTCSTGETVPTGGPQVSVQATASRCLLVSWQPPSVSQARGAITQYKVQWKRVNQSSTNFETLPGYMNQYRITGLQSGQEYLVRVIGATALGWPDLDQKQAPWINITTPQSHLSTLPPPQAQLKSLNSSTILIEWTYPDYTPIEGFKLTYRKMTHEVKDIITLQPNTTTYFLTDLEPGSWYEISLNAFTSEMEGEVCVESVLTHDPPSMALLPPPMNVEAQSLSPTSINITWTSPGPNITYYYTVTYCPLNQNSSGQKLRTNVTSIQVTGLKPNTVYELVVLAHGLNNQISLNSSKLECRTLHEFPGIIEDIQWKVLTSSSARVSWKFVGKKTAVNQYTIFYTSDISAPQRKWQQVSVSDSSNSIELTGLSPNKRYVIKVQASAEGSISFFSPSYYFNTSSDNANHNILPTSQEPHKPHKNSQSDQFLGILVGCGISICCIALCTGTLLYRRRCVKYPRPSSTNSNSQHPPCSAQHEMQSLTNLDAKGGYTNERANGLKFPLMYNGTVPNGQVREKSVRITENPQYEVYKGQEGEGSRTTDEGDSLLSGPELELEGDETQLTIVDSSMTKDIVPDDGFHETTHNLLAPNG